MSINENTSKINELIEKINGLPLAGSGSVDLSEYAKKEEIPTKLSQLQNDAGFLTEPFETDTTLTLKDGVLSVNTTDQMEQDNTLPITSAGVYATVGNIESLLKTI